MDIIKLPRQQGKTRIIIDEAEGALRRGKSVLVLVNTNWEARYVRTRIYKRFEDQCPTCGHAKKIELPAKLAVSPLPFAPRERFDLVLVDNLDVILANLVGQPVDIATIARGES